MRIVLWNCDGGLARKPKVDFLKALEPDVAVLPEIREQHIEGLAPRDSRWVTNNSKTDSPKGLGVLTFKQYSLEDFSRDEEMEIYFPLRVRSQDFSFNLLAVWNFYYASKTGRFKGVRGKNSVEYTSADHYRSFLADPSLLVGDLNFGPDFGRGFTKYCGVLNQIGLKSLYHQDADLDVGQTKLQTYKPNRGGKKYHLDHIFGSQFFQKRLARFHCEPLEKVPFSDHAALVIDFKL
jgi:exonuclease III